MGPAGPLVAPSAVALLPSPVPGTLTVAVFGALLAQLPCFAAGRRVSRLLVAGIALSRGDGSPSSGQRIRRRYWVPSHQDDFEATDHNACAAELLGRRWVYRGGLPSVRRLIGVRQPSVRAVVMLGRGQMGKAA